MFPPARFVAAMFAPGKTPVTVDAPPAKLIGRVPAAFHVVPLKYLRALLPVLSAAKSPATADEGVPGPGAILIPATLPAKFVAKVHLAAARKLPPTVQGRLAAQNVLPCACVSLIGHASQRARPPSKITATRQPASNFLTVSPRLDSLAL